MLRPSLLSLPWATGAFPRFGRPSLKARRGFALVERLVAIAIIAILAAILPVSPQVRKQTHAAQCMASLRQLTIDCDARTGYDPGGVEGPTHVLTPAQLEEPSCTVLFAETASGDMSLKYRGYLAAALR